MEPKKNKIRNIVVISIAAVVVIVVASFTIPKLLKPAFCFNFAHDMQFGDREVSHPVNKGTPGLNGILYFLPEVPALQAALVKQGFYVDDYEITGGRVYSAAFFGPSTRTAVMSFQKKYNLPQTGQVTNDTIDKLSALYKCPPVATSTTAVKIATTTPKTK